ncbi:MAG: GNAT family N-acetyltransferase [Rhodospirillaceae bacterium]|nr:GNAT family N-acetyltransferase [Rhodospirillales bacterium]
MDEIIIRTGCKEDMPWVTQLLIDGVAGRHFNPTVNRQADGLLNEILRCGAFEMMKARHGTIYRTRVNARFDVAEINGEPASFLITLSEGRETELHLTGTKKQFRRRGCARRLAQHAIELANNQTRIFARCYRASSFAIDSLKKMGFVQDGEDKDTVELALKL